MSAANTIDFAARIRELARAHVLVVGDIMLDRFVSGSVNRISPEAPVPVLEIEHAYSMLGGAGNVIRNIAALRAVPSFIGVIGDDGEGEEVRSLLTEVIGQADKRLLVEAGRTDDHKDTLSRARPSVVTGGFGGDGASEPETAVALIAATEDALDGIEVVVLSDYAKGVLGPTAVSSLIQTAQRAGCRVIVDPKMRDFNVYNGASLITPNRGELIAATGISASTDAETEQACKQVLAKHDIAAVLATRSAEGMTLATREGDVHHLPANAREVYDVSGAGDTVAAVLSAVLDAGVELIEAAHLANLAAGIVVGKVGTAVVRPEKLIRYTRSTGPAK